jgi:DNA-binding IclR family transcriptional regulator
MPTRSTVASDERAFDILESLKRRGSTGVTELAGALDMPKSTVHAHLSTLRDRGYVVQEDDDRYRLGLRFLDFGMVARLNRQLYTEVQPHLEELAAETGEKAWCAVEENGQAVLVGRAVGDRAVHTNARVGQHVELHRLGAGIAILASLDADRRREILDGYDFPLHGAADTRAALEAELTEVRDRGVAYGTDRFIQGVSSVAAPVTDNAGRVYGAIGVSGPTNRLSGRLLESELADVVRGMAGELQLNLSYR